MRIGYKQQGWYLFYAKKEIKIEDFKSILLFSFPWFLKRKHVSYAQLREKLKSSILKEHTSLKSSIKGASAVIKIFFVF